MLHVSVYVAYLKRLPGEMFVSTMAAMMRSVMLNLIQTSEKRDSFKAAGDYFYKVQYNV